MKGFSPRLLAMVTVAVLALMAAGLWFYQNEHHGAQQEASEQLESISRLKVGQITAWRANQLDAGTELMGRRAFVQDVARWLAQSDAALPENIPVTLRSLQVRYRYHDVLVVDAGGLVRHSLTGFRGPLHAEAAAALATALRERRPVLADLHAGPEGLLSHLDLVAPLGIEQAASGGRPFGAVILQCDPREFLYPFLQAWPVASASAETLLVRRDGDSVVFLHTLRHRRDTALKLRLPLTETNVPAVKVVLGGRGVMQGEDYRGVQVLSVLSAIPNSPWFMVAKVDEAEALAGWHTRSRLIVALLLLAVALAGTAFLVAWQRQGKNHFRALHQAGEELRESEAKFRRLFESMAAGCCIDEIVYEGGKAVDYRVLDINPAFEKIIGVSRSQAVGALASKLYGGGKPPFFDTYVKVAEAGIPASFEAFLPPIGKHLHVTASCPRWGRFSTVLTDITERKQAEEQLRASEERYRSILHASPDAIFITDVKDGRQVMVSPGAVKLLGCARAEDLIGQPLVDYIIPEDRARAVSNMVLTLQGQPPGPVEYRGQRADGSRFDMEANTEVIRDASGGPTQIVAIVRDMTKRKREEEALQKSETKYRMLFNLFPVGVTVANAAGQIIEANQAAEEILGLTVFDQKQRKIDGMEWAIVRLDGTPMPAEEYASLRALTEQRPIRGVEMGIVRSPVDTRWIVVSASPLPDRGVVIIYEDITQRKRAEAELGRMRNLLREGQQIAHLGSWEYMAETQETRWSEEQLRIYGLNPAGRSPDYQVMLRHHIHPDDAARLDKTFRDCLQNGAVFELEHRLVRPDGSLRVVQELAGPYFDDHGRLVRYVGTTLDITERKQAEAAAQASETRIQTVFALPLIGICITSLAKEWLEFNDHLCTMLGYERKELPHTNWAELTHPDDLSADSAQFERVLRGEIDGYSLEKRFLRKDGAILHADLAVRCVRRADRTVDYLVVLIQDITERKRAEEEIKAKTEQLAQSNDELTRFNRLMSNREMRVIELKQQVNALAAQLGEPRPYPLAFLDAAAETTIRNRPSGQAEPDQRLEVAS